MGYHVSDEIRAREMYKEFIELITWIDPDAVLMIVIDHLEAGVPYGNEVYDELFSLLLQLGLFPAD